MTPENDLAEISNVPTMVGVPTALPVFVGYTEKAVQNGEPVPFRAVKIASLADYETVFGGDAPGSATIVEVLDPIAIKAGAYDFTVEETATLHYFRLEAASQEYYLYNSLRLFYANGGNSAFVISVGSYADRVALPALLQGLAVAGDQVGPTLLAIPDALLLPPSNPNTPWVCADFQVLAQAQLCQAASLQDRFALLDVYGGQRVDRQTLSAVAQQFRAAVGDQGLDFGAAYFPCVEATVVAASEITFQNITNLDLLQQILGWEIQNLYGGTPKAQEVQAEVDAMANAMANAASPAQLNQNLVTALPLLGTLEKILLQRKNLLPACGILAGLFTSVDNQQGVWNAPANLSVNAVAQPSLAISTPEQVDLVQPSDGKTINVLREFAGRGTVVWGAGTLKGNDPDYRYIQIRRTLIYIEQSIKTALDPFVFAPNDGNTWVVVVSMVSNFLQSIWSQGGLMGATAQEAFSVQCGLDNTMTAFDIAEGYMIVQVNLQMIRPAEFIELTFKQKMEGVG